MFTARMEGQAMTLTDTQKQLVLLAMDQSSAEGERSNAANAFFRLLRAEFADGYELLTKLTGKVENPGSVYGSVVCPFKKHKGKRLDECPIDYLLWCLDNHDTMSRSMRRAIERYLQDAQYAN
jgi:hypothetical protein